MSAEPVVTELTIDASGSEQGQARYVRAMANAEAAAMRMAAANGKLLESNDAQVRATEKVAAANDNISRRFQAVNDNVRDVGKSFASTSEEIAKTAKHLITAGIAAYNFFPAFRALVNPSITNTLKAIGPTAAAAVGIAFEALSPLLALISRFAIPIFAIVAAWKALNYVINLGSGLLDKYANAGRSLFGENVDENLKKLTKYQNETILPQQVQYATELGVRLAAAKRTIDEFLKIQFDLTGPALFLQGIWVGIVEQIAKAVDWAGRLPQKLPTFNGDPSGLSLADPMGTGMPSYQPARADVGKADREALSAIALARQKLGVLMGVAAVANKDASIGSSFAARFTANIEALAGKTEEAKEKVKTLSAEFGRLEHSLERAAAAQEADTQAVGASVGEHARLRAEFRLLEAAQQDIAKNGSGSLDDYAERIKKISDRIGAATQNTAQLQAQNRASFDLQTVGLSDVERQIATVQQQLHGNAWPKFMNDGLAATMRVTEGIKQLQDWTASFATTLAHALIDGVSGAKALAASLKQVGLSMLDSAIKDISKTSIGALFGGGTQAAAQTAGATTAASILTTAGATVAASFIAGATSAATILGIGGATAGGSVAAGSSLGGGILGVAGGAAGGQVAAGGIVAGEALAVGGAVAGTSLWGPIALLIAAAAAIAGAAFLSSGDEQVDPAVQALEAAQQAWRDMADELKQFINTMNGNSGGSFTSALSGAAEQAKRFIKAAQEADQRTGKIFDALQVFTQNLVRSFLGTFDIITGALNSGLGFDSPAVKAAENIKSIGEQLKGFIQDTSKVNDLVVNGYPIKHAADALLLPGSLDDPAAVVVAAKQAAQQYAVSLLQTAPVLSDVETKVLALNGAAAQLRLTLQDLGMSATDAAAAVATGMTAALDAIRLEFTQGLQAKINEATGKGYLNDVGALITERSGLLRDASLIGADPNLVAQYFAAQAQQIVNGAQLVGAGFDDLLIAFPQLAGIVHAFVEDTQNSADALAAAADRAKDYADRLFDATNDDSTLAGALLAFDRRAQDERAQELAAGGQAIVDLERAQAAERLNIVKDFNQKIIDQAKSILDYVQSLKTGSNSALSPVDQLAAAQQQYSAQLALARGGDLAALSGITNVSSTLLDIARNFYASSAEYKAIFTAVTNDLTALAGGHAHGGIVGGYAAGGIVGNGIWNMDSVVARYAGGGRIGLAGGEGIVNAAATRAIGPSAIDFINRRGALPTNDNGAHFQNLGQTFVRELGNQNRVLASGFNNSVEVMREELRAVREELADVKRAIRTQGERSPRPGSGKHASKAA